VAIAGKETAAIKWGEEVRKKRPMRSVVFHRRRGKRGGTEIGHIDAIKLGD